MDIYGEEPFWCNECADKLEEGEFDEEIDSEEGGYFRLRTRQGWGSADMKEAV